MQPQTSTPDVEFTPVTEGERTAFLSWLSDIIYRPSMEKAKADHRAAQAEEGLKAA
ncbi:MAG: hypothetical protein LH650_13280 [Chloroflexi bacterium]|nr:hypothetical protein [Chloroflexota bacterium]